MSKHGHLLDPAVGARNPVSSPPLNGLLHVNNGGHLPWDLLSLAEGSQLHSPLWIQRGALWWNF